MDRFGYRPINTLTTVWQRTKSPIHIYGTIKMGDSDMARYGCAGTGTWAASPR
jgi:hypothetical protein